MQRVSDKQSQHDAVIWVLSHEFQGIKSDLQLRLPTSSQQNIALEIHSTVKPLV